MDDTSSKSREHESADQPHTNTATRNANGSAGTPEEEIHLAEELMDGVASDSGTLPAAAATMVRRGESTAQTFRWVVGVVCSLVALKIVVDGWAPMNLKAVSWWQTPLAGIVAACVAVMIFFGWIAFVLVCPGCRRRSSNRQTSKLTLRPYRPEGDD